MKRLWTTNGMKWGEQTMVYTCFVLHWSISIDTVETVENFVHFVTNSIKLNPEVFTGRLKAKQWWNMLLIDTLSTKLCKICVRYAHWWNNENKVVHIVRKRIIHFLWNVGLFILITYICIFFYINIFCGNDNVLQCMY